MNLISMRDRGFENGPRKLELFLMHHLKEPPRKSARARSVIIINLFSSTADQNSCLYVDTKINTNDIYCWGLKKRPL